MRSRRLAVRSALLAGIGPRLATAILIAVSLWALFFWATSTPGNP